MLSRLNLPPLSPRARIAVASVVALTLLVPGVIVLGPGSGAEDQGGAGDVAPAALEPVVELPTVVSGPEAVDALGGEDGDDLAAVAEEHGWSVEHLVETLTNDETLNVDRSGRLFYADTIDAHADHGGHAEHGEPRVEASDTGPEVASYATSGRTGSDVLPEGALVPLEETFRLNSGGGSSQLFLDFDGHDFGSAGNAWGLGGKANAWDPAGDGPGFSDTELIRVQRIWAMVSEHFSFLNVDVTTRETAPPSGGYRLRVVVSPSLRYANRAVSLDPTDTPGATGGTVGLAFVNTAREPSYDSTPALVFADGLRHADDATFAWTISHEFGHNYGLRHAFENPPYQPNIAQGSSATSFSALLMDYAGGPSSAFFTNQERAYVHNGSGHGSSSQYRSLSLFAPADRSTPFGAEDTPAVRRGVWSGRNPFDLSGSAPTTRAIDLGTVRCTGGVRVVVEPAAPLAPLFDARIRLLDGDAVVATATEPTGPGTAERSAGLGATLEFETDPDVTYRVVVDTDPDGVAWAGGGDVAYGRFAAAISGEGCGFVESAPSEPRGVTAVAEQGTGAVTLRWDAPIQPGGGGLAHEVAVDGRRVARVAAGATSMRLTDLPDGGTWVRVRAVNDRGASEWVRVRTPHLVPQAPVHVSAVRDAAGNVRISVVHARGFVPSSNQGTARVHLAGEGAGFFPLRASATSSLLGGQYFVQAEGYRYVLTGAKGQTSTPFVVRDAVTAPGAPEGATVSVAGDSAEIRWEKPRDDGGAFAAYRVSVDGGAWTAVDGFTFAHELESLSPGAHTVRVVAVHDAGESAPAEVAFVVDGVGAVAPASAPREVEIIEDAAGTRLVWSEPSRLRGATVQRWLVTVGGRQVSVAPGGRRLELTGFRSDRVVTVTVAAVTERDGVTAVGAASTVSLAPAP